MKEFKGTDPDFKPKALAALCNTLSKLTGLKPGEITEDTAVGGQTWARARVELIVGHQYSVRDTDEDIINGLTVGQALQKITYVTN